MTDIDYILEAADAIEARLPLTPAEAAGGAIIDRLDPETRSKLQAWLDNHQV